MSQTVNKGDYLILNVVAGKRVLARCNAVSPDGKKCRAVVETPGDEEPPIEFKAREVLANLGNSPHAGSAYGVKIEPLRERIEHPWWGSIAIHHPLDDQSRKTLKRTMQDVQEKLKKSHRPKLPIETQIRTQQGSMAGFYKFRPKAEADVLCVKLDDDMSDLEYRFSHEYAHGLWYRCFTPKMKMAWVNRFHDAVNVSAYSNKELQALLDAIVNSEDLRSFVKENPEEMPVLRAIFRHMKQTHSIDRNHFEMAMVIGQDVSGYWPNAVELGEKQTIISKYATKSPEELWAEVFSLKFIGKKIPSRLDELLDKCLRSLTSSGA